MSDYSISPLPWSVGDVIILDAKGDDISTCNGHCPSDTDRANAAFIVQAVNSHAELVKALEKAVRLCHVPEDEWGEVCEERRADCEALLNKTKSAQ